MIAILINALKSNVALLVGAVADEQGTPCN